MKNLLAIAFTSLLLLTAILALLWTFNIYPEQVRTLSLVTACPAALFGIFYVFEFLRQEVKS